MESRIELSNIENKKQNTSRLSAKALSVISLSRLSHLLLYKIYFQVATKGKQISSLKIQIKNTKKEHMHLAKI